MEGHVLNTWGGGSSQLDHRSSRLQALDDRVKLLKHLSIDDSTRSGYGTGYRSYLRFCNNFDLPLNPTPLTLARYIAYTSQSIASGPKYLSGAKHFLQDQFPDFSRSRSSPLVKSVIAGSKKLRADAVHRKAPLRMFHLQQFLSKFSSRDSYDDLLFLTILSCAFYACHRIGELIVRSPGKVDLRKVIRRSSILFPDSGHVSYWLPFHKGDRFFRGTEILLGPQKILDPVSLLRQYTALRDAKFGARLPLFICNDGSLPSRSWFESRFFSLLTHEFGGHSLRAGGATFYASLGLSETVIQALGRWSSDSWKIYIRDNPSIRAEIELANIQRRSSSH